MKVVFKAADVKLEQRANHRFRVTYRLQVRDDLGYGDAAKELGCCLMHQLACDGELDNEEVDT